MMVTDLHHFLDLPVDTPGPARRLAEQLSSIVRAGTAGDVATAWETALPCRRRPGNRRCTGRIIVRREPEASTPIRWHCSACDDEGLISNWADSPFDLRPRRLTRADDVHEVVITADVAATLRELQLLDPDCERIVFRIRAHDEGAALTATDDDLEQLVGAVAAEANHEPHRGRQRRLDTAFDALNDAAQTPGNR
jgi:hypothetical protein